MPTSGVWLPDFSSTSRGHGAAVHLGAETNHEPRNLAVQHLLMVFMEDIIADMAGYVPLAAIADRILSEFAADQLGDFKGSLVGLLAAYNYELSILQVCIGLSVQIKGLLMLRLPEERCCILSFHWCLGSHITSHEQLLGQVGHLMVSWTCCAGCQSPHVLRCFPHSLCSISQLYTYLYCPG